MHNWKKLVFDIVGPTDRAEYQFGREGHAHNEKTLPITHESDPLYHAALCRLVDEGGTSLLASEAINFTVSVATTVPLDIPRDSPPENVDFSTLIDSMDAMEVAYEKGKSEA